MVNNSTYCKQAPHSLAGKAQSLRDIRHVVCSDEVWFAVLDVRHTLLDRQRSATLQRASRRLRGSGRTKVPMIAANDLSNLYISDLRCPSVSIPSRYTSERNAEPHTRYSNPSLPCIKHQARNTNGLLRQGVSNLPRSIRLPTTNVSASRPTFRRRRIPCANTR